MFEYYKWKLANKQVGNAVNKLNEKEPVAKRVWILMLVFATAFSLSESLPLVGIGESYHENCYS